MQAVNGVAQKTQQQQEKKERKEGKRTMVVDATYVFICSFKRKGVSAQSQPQTTEKVRVMAELRIDVVFSNYARLHLHIYLKQRNDNDEREHEHEYEHADSMSRPPSLRRCLFPSLLFNPSLQSMDGRTVRQTKQTDGTGINKRGK